MKTLLTLTLAVVCIALGSAYFFTTNNMMMFEMLISAIPSFVLSLQPNTDRVKGKFIPYVLSRAIPGGLTLAIGILSLYVIRQTSLADNFGFIKVVDGETVETLEYSALMMLALTFVGLVMLFRICQPFNIVRAILFISMAILCATVVAVPFLGGIVFDGWSQVNFTLDQILLIIIIVQATLPLSSVFIKFFDLINPADD